MTDWIPQVVKIEQVKRHPNTDTLDVVTVLGDFQVIVKRDEYKVDDIAGYIPIDSIVQDTEQFHFLSPKSYERYEDKNGNVQQRQMGPKYPVGQVPEKYRIIKAKRIRGVYSQGMLVPVPNEYSVGASIVDYLGLTKWDEPEEENVPRTISIWEMVASLCSTYGRAH